MQIGTVGAHDGIHAQIGGGGGILLGRRLLIGAYGMGMASYTERYFHTDTADWRSKLEMDHSGILLQYAITPSKPVHPFAGLQLGWGRVRWNFDVDDDEDADHNGTPDGPPDLHDRAFVITPSVGLQLNITRWFRPDIYAGYRIVDGLDLPGIGASDLNGFFLGVNAMFGGMGD